MLSTQSDIVALEKSIKIQLNIDGLPLFRSSSGQFWPILGWLENIGKWEPFIIGLFYGNSKPKNVSPYLNALVEEINQLVTHGIVYADEQFDILISILTTQGIICGLALSVVVLEDRYLKD